MTTPHDAPRWVYIGGKLVQAKPDAPDHDSSPLYVLARDHAALLERLTKERDEARTALDSHARAALASGGRG